MAGCSVSQSLLVLGAAVAWMLAYWDGIGPAGIWAMFILALGGAGTALTVSIWRETAVPS